MQKRAYERDQKAKQYVPDNLKNNEYKKEALETKSQNAILKSEAEKAKAEANSQ